MPRQVTQPPVVSVAAPSYSLLKLRPASIRATIRRYFRGLLAAVEGFAGRGQLVVSVIGQSMRHGRAAAAHGGTSARAWCGSLGWRGLPPGPRQVEGVGPRRYCDIERAHVCCSWPCRWGIPRYRGTGAGRRSAPNENRRRRFPYARAAPRGRVVLHAFSGRRSLLQGQATPRARRGQRCTGA